jgi:hypothetical protein
MRQAIIKNNNDHSPKLRIVKESRPAENDQLQLVNTAWNFAYTALWNTVQFSLKEIEKAKQQIAAWLQSENKEKTFIAFCERVLLARQYVNKNSGRYIPLPSVWLDSNNKLGFAGTQKWYDNMKNIRESLPAYKTEIRALAEAMLEISKEPSADNYRYWRTYFMDHHKPGLLNLFQTAAIQQLYN